MIGTTRSSVSFFMNKFRKLGLIDYNGSIEIHISLLNVVLRDQRRLSAKTVYPNLTIEWGRAGNGNIKHNGGASL
jgi:hypothetical protein